MKIYYAHSRMKYNTMIEQYEIALIRKRFPDAEIINPNGTVDQTAGEEAIMEECLRLVDSCDMLVFSSVDGMVGKGVTQEVERMKRSIKGSSRYPHRIQYIHGNCLEDMNPAWAYAGLLKSPTPDIPDDMIYAIVL